MLQHWIGKPKPAPKSNVYNLPEKKVTQEELNDLIRSCPFKVGDIVAYKSAASDPVTAGTCDIVVEFVTDKDKVTYQYDTGKPCFIRLMSCYTGAFTAGENQTPFNRLSCVEDIKKISGYHYNKLIIPVYDKLQDRVQHLKKTLNKPT